MEALAILFAGYVIADAILFVNGYKWIKWKDEVKEEDEKQLFMDPDDKMWEVSYDHGPHQSNTIKVKAKSQSHAWEVAKEVAKKKYGHARITSGGVTQVKEVKWTSAKEM
jgi:hypothetical protein